LVRAVEGCPERGEMTVGLTAVMRSLSGRPDGAGRSNRRIQLACEQGGA
jgi:hypothetical protein